MAEESMQDLSKLSELELTQRLRALDRQRLAIRQQAAPLRAALQAKLRESRVAAKLASVKLKPGEVDVARELLQNIRVTANVAEVGVTAGSGSGS